MHFLQVRLVISCFRHVTNTLIFLAYIVDVRLRISNM